MPSTNFYSSLPKLQLSIFYTFSFAPSCLLTILPYFPSLYLLAHAAFWEISSDPLSRSELFGWLISSALSPPLKAFRFQWLHFSLPEILLNSSSNLPSLSLSDHGFDSLLFNHIKHIQISLEVQWLRFHASGAGGMGSIPGPRTKISCCKIKKKPIYIFYNINQRVIWSSWKSNSIVWHFC